MCLCVADREFLVYTHRQTLTVVPACKRGFYFSCATFSREGTVLHRHLMVPSNGVVEMMT